MALPIFKTELQELALLQTKWAAQLNTLLSNPVLNGITLSDIQLASGDNVINHKLGRKLQGWVITRIAGPAVIYDKQSSNSMPELTLVLNASAPVLVNIYVY